MEQDTVCVLPVRREVLKKQGEEAEPDSVLEPANQASFHLKHCVQREIRKARRQDYLRKVLLAETRDVLKEVPYPLP